MSWNSVFPDGSKSVKQNEAIGQANTTYIEDTMGNSTNTSKDHYWDIGTNEDGHHRAVQFKNYEDSFSGAPTDPTLATDMVLALYARDGTGFMRNAAQIMQLLGIRALAVFDNVAGNNVAQTLTVSHNVTSVTRQATGRFSVIYTNALPNDNYLVLGGGMQSTDNSTFNPLSLSVSSAASVAARKNTTGMIILTHVGSTLTNQLQGWFICFGG